MSWPFPHATIDSAFRLLFLQCLSARPVAPVKRLVSVVSAFGNSCKCLLTTKCLPLKNGARLRPHGVADVVASSLADVAAAPRDLSPFPTPRLTHTAHHVG